MGRPTKEEQAAKAAAANTAPNVPNEGAEGVVGNGNTPGTNSHEGILQKQEEAEKDAGLIPVDPAKVEEPLDINAQPGVNEGDQIQNGLTGGDIANSQEMQEAGVIPGDTVKEAQGKIQENRDAMTVTEEDLQNIPFAAEAGIFLGQDRGEGFRLFTEHLEKNPHLYPKEDPRYKPEVEVKNLADLLEEGVELNEEEIKLLVFNGILDESGEKVLIEDKFTDFLEDKARIEAENPTQDKKDKHIYHGDFLTESQMGNKITFDWDEVTAPEHLAIKPETPPPFTDGKKQ